MSVAVCVPVLNRYDLLRELLLSLTVSTVRPDVRVIDNGYRPDLAERAAEGLGLDVQIYTPWFEPLGVAGSWNRFIRETSGERFILNDDITLQHDSLERMLASPLPFVSCGFGFSCFLIRDACVERVGLFDEEISPGYAYFEDRDYYHRMRLVGLEDAVIDCGVNHAQSQTLLGYTEEQAEEHHRRFIIAQTNFVKKWGSLPADVEAQFR